MIAADRPGGRSAKLLTLNRDGALRRLPRAALATVFGPGDLVVANDAATLPASLHGAHDRSQSPIEVRLAGWVEAGDPRRFIAVVFGEGDHRIRTEHRPPPPPLSPGDRLSLGPLSATVERRLDHPRLVLLRFAGPRDAVLAGIARHGRPVQYAHVPQPLDLWDVWTPLAARPLAFEPPSAGFALDWSMVAALRRRGVRFATLTHAAGLSSTGDPVLDDRLPFDEPYDIPNPTARAVADTKSTFGRVIAIGTTVVRALESACDFRGRIRPGPGIATGRITAETPLRAVDAILSGVHQPGESHFELLRAFADAATLGRATAQLAEHGFRSHEFGDSVLIERQRHTPAIAVRNHVHAPSVVDA